MIARVLARDKIGTQAKGDGLLGDTDECYDPAGGRWCNIRVHKVKPQVIAAIQLEYHARRDKFDKEVRAHLAIMLHFLTLLRQVRILDAAAEESRQSDALELAEVKARAANSERQAQELAKETAALKKELQATRAQRSQISTSVSFQTFLFHYLNHPIQRRYKRCKPRSSRSHVD